MGKAFPAFSIVFAISLLSSPSFSRELRTTCAVHLARLHPHIRNQVRSSGAVACLESALRRHGKNSPGQRALSDWLRAGSHELSTERLAWAARQFGFRADVREFVSIDDLTRMLAAGETVIVRWNYRGPRYSVVNGIDSNSIYLMEPESALAATSFPLWYFYAHWREGGEFIGQAVRLTPG